VNAFLLTDWFLPLSILLLGLVVGSFLNVVIYRLPRMMEQNWRRECHEFLEQTPPKEEPLSLAFPNSHCRECQTAIRPWHNIPVISFLLLGGKCAACQAPISYRYPIVELGTGLLFLAAALTFLPGITLIGALLFISALVALTGIDIDTQLLPDSITLPLLWLGLLINLNAGFTNLNDAVIGAAAGYMTLWTVFWAFKLSTGKEGMGYGDFKLLAALGAWFGWQALPLIIILSSFVGAFVGILMIVLRRQEREAAMPFGPYLAGAGLITLFYGDALVATYFQIVGL
jgi:leader peptidase (prepilin peptidase)/N-methyltransferase